MQAFTKDDAVSGLDVEEADDALEGLHVRNQVQVVQLLVRSQAIVDLGSMLR
jgi:hypothetical protein